MAGFTVSVQPVSSAAVVLAPVAGRIGTDPATLPWRPLLLEYLADLGLKQDCAQHIRNQRETVDRCAKVCGWATVADFRADTTREWLLGLQRAGRAPKTLRLYRDSLDRFGGWLVKRGHLIRNPVDGIPKARVVPRQARVVPTDQEVSRLIAGVYGRKQAGDRWLVYLTAASTGLRHGTIRQLTWAMVDLDAGRLTIPAAILKNRRPMVVHLTGELVTALTWHRAKGDGPAVFRFMPKPEQFTKDALRAGIRLREAGATMSFHSLRHYFSNRLMRSGATLEERKLAVGHLNGGMTLSTYTSPELVRVGERVKALPSLLIGEKYCQQPALAVDTRANGRLDSRCSGVPHAGLDMVATLPTHDLSTARPDPADGLNNRPATIMGGPSVVVNEQGVAQLGRAGGLGPPGRMFKSCHPDFQTSPVLSVPGEGGPQVQIQQPCSGAADPVSPPTSQSVVDAFLASHAVLARLVDRGLL